MSVDWFQKFFLICVFLNFQACTNGVTLWQWTYGLILMTQVTDPHIPIYSKRKIMSQFPHMKMSWHILSFRTLWLKYQILRFIILLLELKVIWQSTISLSCLVACRLFRSTQALFWSLTREPDTTSSPGSKLQVSSMLASNYALYLSKLEKAWTFF